MPSASDTSNADNQVDPPPVGQGDYVVQPGDCMESIAFPRGFVWQTLWKLSQNAELNRQRDPNVLLPGDRVTIPDLRVREESAPTDQKHVFVRHGYRSRLQLRFLDEEQKPRAGLAYVITVDGVNTTGKLDGNGSLKVPIRPNASQGKVQLLTDPEPETYDLDLGYLDPYKSAAGLRARLNNLGFACAAGGAWDDDLAGALRRFQAARDLPPTGTLDDATAQLLKSDHKS